LETIQELLKMEVMQQELFKQLVVHQVTVQREVRVVLLLRVQWLQVHLVRLRLEVLVVLEQSHTLGDWLLKMVSQELFPAKL
jgi:hypothetical protein